ncbi:MAG TPA: lysylphosphatidylglycerol synthase transmembrane domain-containing protein [Anaerolineaceae bacterium]
MKRWQFWGSIVISAVLLYFALRGQNLGQVWTALQGANYLWIFPGVAVYFIGVYVRAWRWHYLLRPLKKISTAKMFPIVTIGYFGNNVTPARAGEVLRAYILKRHEGVPISASLATIIVERIFDAIVMLMFVFLNFSEVVRLSGNSVNIMGWSIQNFAVLGTVIAIVILVIFLAAAMFPYRTEKVVRWAIAHFVPKRIRQKTLDLSLRFLTGLESLRSPQEALMIFVTSTIIWLLETGKYWFVMQAFPNVHVSFFGLMLMNGIVNLATTIPAAPGYVGTFDLPGIALLQAYGVAGGDATGYTLVLHAALWLPITILGAFYFAREGIKWENLSKEDSPLKSEAE